MLRLYIKVSGQYTEVTEGLISIEAALDGRYSDYPFIDGGRTQMMDTGGSVRAVMSLCADSVQAYLINAAATGERVDVRLDLEGYTKGFTGTVMIEKVYSSAFFGTEMLLSIRQ